MVDDWSDTRPENIYHPVRTWLPIRMPSSPRFVASVLRLRLRCTRPGSTTPRS